MKIKNKIKKPLEEIEFNLSGSHIHIIWKDEERLISIKDLIDAFKNDMDDLKIRDDTDSSMPIYMEEKLIEELGKLQSYAKKTLIDANHVQDKIIH